MSIVREVSFEVERRSGVRPEVIDVVRVLYGDTKGRYETEWGMTEEARVCLAAADLDPTKDRRRLRTFVDPEHVEDVKIWSRKHHGA